jgi:hypothetical protein
MAGECREKPAVQMDERAAESHLVARKNPELPSSRSKLLRSDRVVVLVTVDRDGAICHARAVTGPKDLRALAVSAVRKHWRFRPFLVDWKPVVAQFPVSVRFVRLRTEPKLRAGSRSADLLIGMPTPVGGVGATF